MSLKPTRKIEDETDEEESEVIEQEEEIQQPGPSKKPDFQLSREEVVDMIIGTLQRAAELANLLR